MSKPKRHTQYYVPSLCSIDETKAQEHRWDDDEFDNMFYDRGIVCHSKEDAENLFDELVLFARDLTLVD